MLLDDIQCAIDINEYYLNQKLILTGLYNDFNNIDKTITNTGNDYGLVKIDLFEYNEIK
jgi:hypothetical protein